MDKFSPENQALQINTLTLMMEQNTKDHEEIKKSIESFGRRLDESLERMENTKADKWVEKFLLWAGAIIGASVLTGMCYLLVKAVIHLSGSL